MKVSPATVLVGTLLAVTLLLSHFAFARVARVRYDGFQLWRAKPQSRDQADAIYSLQQYGVQLWREPIVDPSGDPDKTASADLFIAPASIPAIAATLSDAEVEYEVVIPDMQPLIDAEQEKMENNPSTRKHEFSFTGWQQYETIISYMRDLADYSGGRIQLVTMDERSTEDLPLHVLKIRSEDSWNKPEVKPVVFIEGGMHAREWISPAVALYIANELANNVDGPEGSLNRRLLEKFDFHIYPLANPDGYKYTQVDRMWRKSRTRGPTLLNWCPGVDLNRNFDVKWNETYGGSTFPCANDYKGAAPFSEPETRALSKYWKDLGDNFKAYFSFHSYGQIWAYPYGYKRADPVDHLVFAEVVNKGAEKLRASYSAKYQLGSAAQLLYLVTGSSMDYAYDVLKVKHSYLLELRPRIGAGGPEQGFLLNPELIIPTCIETWAGVREALDYVHKDLYGYKATQGLEPTVGERTVNDEVVDEVPVAEQGISPAEKKSALERQALDEDSSVQTNEVEKTKGPLEDEVSVDSQSGSSEVSKEGVESAEKAADGISKEETQKQESTEDANTAAKGPESQQSEEDKVEDPKNEPQKSEEIESSDRREPVSAYQSGEKASEEVPASNDDAAEEVKEVEVSNENEGKPAEDQKVSDEEASQEVNNASDEKKEPSSDEAASQDPSKTEDDKIAADEKKEPSSDEAASQDPSKTEEEDKTASAEELEARQAVSAESTEDQQSDERVGDEASKEKGSSETVKVEDKSQEVTSVESESSKEQSQEKAPSSDEIKDQPIKEKSNEDLKEPSSQEANDEASQEASKEAAKDPNSDEDQGDSSKEFRLPYPALVLLRKLDEESSEGGAAASSEEQLSATDEAGKVQDLPEAASHGYEPKEGVASSEEVKSVEVADSNEKGSDEVSDQKSGSDEVKDASGELPVQYLLKLGGIHD